MKENYVSNTSNIFLIVGNDLRLTLRSFSISREISRRLIILEIKLYSTKLQPNEYLSYTPCIAILINSSYFIHSNATQINSFNITRSKNKSTQCAAHQPLPVMNSGAEVPRKRTY